MKLKFIVTILLLLFIISQNFAQEKSNVKFGKITAEDFKQHVYSIDSNANAIIIADIGSTEIVGNDKGNFSVEFSKFRRVHILNKNGYDAANVEIGIYTDGHMEEDVNSLKAVTYNLEDGKVVETKLDTKSNVFKDKLNKHQFVKKFTLPNIKEGSIIEFQYKLHSDFVFNLQPWEFQGTYPRLWSEYNVTMPEFYRYITLSQGYEPFYIKTQKDRSEKFYLSESNGAQATEHASFTANVSDYKWVMKNVPALHEENYTTTINNHIARIEFQLAALANPFTPKNIMGTWPDATSALLRDEDFGYSLNRDNPWLNDVMQDAKKGASNDLDKARNIFAYVRDNMTCTDYNREYIEKPLKTVLKNKNGSEVEINLLLTSMLQKAGLSADPVLLSTRSHGYTYALYPLMDRFNYVISRLTLNGKYYYLDASHPGLGFGKLGYNCYNGHARVINEEATAVEFQADSLREGSISSAIIINDEKGFLTGSMHTTPGFYESYDLRNRIKEKGKEKIFSDIKKDFIADVEITNPKIDSLEKYDEPVTISYDFDFKKETEDIIYFNPMLNEAWKENPFKSAERSYPVEMPYAIDQTYLLQLDVPTGYVVDELPKPIKVKLNEDDDGSFEYLIYETGGLISLRSRIQLKRAFYMPEEYQTLREFFNMIVKKQSEQIVFKKKK